MCGPERPYAGVRGLFVDRILVRLPRSASTREASSRHPASGHRSGNRGGSEPACRSTRRAFSPRSEVNHGQRSGSGCAEHANRCSTRRTADTGLADILCRRPLALLTARSTDAPPAPCEPTGSCPAPATPSPAQASPLGLAIGRSADSATARRAASVAPLPNAPYGESRQPCGIFVEVNWTEPLSRPIVSDTKSDAAGALSIYRPPAYGSYTTMPSARVSGGHPACLLGHSYSRNRSSILRLAISCRPSMHLP